MRPASRVLIEELVVKLQSQLGFYFVQEEGRLACLSQESPWT